MSNLLTAKRLIEILSKLPEETIIATNDEGNFIALNDRSDSEDLTDWSGDMVLFPKGKFVVVINNSTFYGNRYIVRDIGDADQMFFSIGGGG